MIVLWFSVVFISLWLLRKYFRDRKYRLPPGPRGLPVLGNLFQLDVNDMRTKLDLWAKQYGPVVFIKLFNADVVVLNDTTAVRKAFCNPHYTKIINEKPYSFLGEYMLHEYRDVLFGMYTETVMKTRTVMMKGLKTAGEMVALQEGGIKDLIGKLENTAGKDFDPKPIIMEAVGNIFCVMLTGERCNEADTKLLWQFEEAANDMVHPVVDAILTNFPWLRHVPGSLRNKYLNALSTRDSVCERFYHKMRETYTEGKIRGLSDVFIELANQQAAYGDSAWFTHIEGQTSVIDVIGAGVVTLSNGLNASFLTLLNHPKVAEKMYTEIEQHVGTSRFPCSGDDLQMPYCTAVAYECLRYTTHVNIILPHRTGTDWEFEGYTIPKDAMVMGNLWTIHHDEKYFPEPWSFRPERFLDDNGQLLSPDHPTREAFIPYSIGRRKCAGATFAEGRLFLFLTTLVQNFTLLPPENGVLLSCDPRGYQTRGIVLFPKDYTCRLVPRSNRPV